MAHLFQDVVHMFHAVVQKKAQERITFTERTK